MLSCTSKKENTEKEKELPSSTSQSEKDNSTTIFPIKGGNSEYGWDIQAMHLAEGIYYNITLDYGEISLSGYGFYSENNTELKIPYGKNEIPITIKPEHCVDQNGDNNELSIRFVFNNKTYKGCGSVNQGTDQLSPPVISEKVDHYICFKANKKGSKDLWISYTSDGYAKKVKYEGQKDSISLDFIAEEFQKGSAYPTVIKYYKEIYNNQLNGWYKITHAGNWDYVEYQNAKNITIFNYTIDHTKNPYSKKPCF